jgi:hypothetical protein
MTTPDMRELDYVNIVDAVTAESDPSDVYGNGEEAWLSASPANG